MQENIKKTKVKTLGRYQSNLHSLHRVIVHRGSIMCRLSHGGNRMPGRNFIGRVARCDRGQAATKSYCATEYKKMMTKCWHAVADKRPRVEDVVAFLDKQVGDDNDAAGATAVDTRVSKR
jgi:hypothetical protein